MMVTHFWWAFFEVVLRCAVWALVVISRAIYVTVCAPGRIWELLLCTSFITPSWRVFLDVGTTMMVL